MIIITTNDFTYRHQINLKVHPLMTTINTSYQDLSFQHLQSINIFKSLNLLVPEQSQNLQLKTYKQEKTQQQKPTGSNRAIDYITTLYPDNYSRLRATQLYK